MYVINQVKSSSKQMVKFDFQDKISKHPLNNPNTKI
jgi:hypothetical protein